jgi:pyruvate dehydrogenase E1 component alpha subunit
MFMTQKENISMTEKGNTTSLIKKYENYYHTMLLIRRFEQKVGQFYGMGKISGFCHLYIGQEAVIVGMLSVATEHDKHITSYRDHGHMIALGSDPGTVMAELMGKAGGCSKGKGGSMHMFDPINNFYGGHGVVGAQVPIGTGLAFAEKYLEKQGIAYVYYGDGAVNQGQVYESFNMAKLWNLPVVYVIENNEYSMGTSVARSTANPELYRRGESFGIPGIRADGMNVFEMEEVAKKAFAHVKAGNGPFLIEAKTYRYKGHSVSDPATYRTKEEVKEMMDTRDPIDQLKDFLLKNKYTNQASFDEIEENVKAIVQKSVDFAEASPFPGEEDLYTDVD